MSDIQQQRRIAILTNPNETLKIECKSWLDLSDNKNKAKLAKAAIAMANSGGGTIALGISEDETNGKTLRCKPRPSDMARYSGDAVGSAINKYAEPELEPHLVFENHPDTGNEHAFVEISGGMQQPIFAKRQFDGEIDKLACYIRKPGPPRSEVPHTAQEWSELLNRCVRANSDRMLDGIRTIVEGIPLDTTATKSEEDKLLEFMTASKSRWQERLDEVDKDDVARLHLGYWTAGFSILGTEPRSTLNELKDIIDSARRVNLGGYDPFEYGHRSADEPSPAGDALEVWLGNPNAASWRTAFDCKFWRATRAGNFYFLEGYFEDGGFRDLEPGRFYDISSSIKLYGEILFFAGRIGRLLGENTEILIFSEVTGTAGRSLYSKRLPWLRYDNKVCRVPLIQLKPTRVRPQQIEDNLVEVLFEFLSPLYEQFNLYKLERQLVAVEIDRLKKRDW